MSGGFKKTAKGTTYSVSGEPAVVTVYTEFGNRSTQVGDMDVEVLADLIAGGLRREHNTRRR